MNFIEQYEISSRQILIVENWELFVLPASNEAQVKKNKQKKYVAIVKI